MDKIKVGFEVTDNWTKGDFRQFIISLIKSNRYEVFIISTDDVSAYVSSVGNTLELDSSHVILTNFTVDKVQAIEDNKIQIYLENLKYVADTIENTTEAYGIYVNESPNKYYVQPKYIVEFERLINNINTGDCGEVAVKAE